ncbi:hypothetical protein EGW08_020166 [Elysia chlorotica]|uniref:Reverse transcriptase domain-containing protein n=1 Tax=Elysia chlorotica TaxID=188477 RepID=A0A433SS19_ELYCH|nr:hypothetical protein EGW08_020166 [Elysia chlorotica]
MGLVRGLAVSLRMRFIELRHNIADTQYDTKIFAEVPDHSDTLQEDLNRLQLWSDIWQLRFNAEKCKVMHIGKNEDPNEYTMRSKGECITLESVSTEKDLGVNIDSDLKFSQHVSIQVNKANRLLALLRRGFTVLDRESLPTLYKSIIRPHLEYGNVVWHPRFKGDEEQLENVQRRATKLIPELKHLEYKDRLEKLDMPSLYFRRARGDMIECYKFLQGIYNIKDSLWFLNARPTHARSREITSENENEEVRTDVEGSEDQCALTLNVKAESEKDKENGTANGSSERLTGD